jgi:hypothetical protein
MQPVHTHPDEHKQFEEICARIGEFEPLPAVAVGPQAQDDERTTEEQLEPIDGLILAGLVSP